MSDSYSEITEETKKMAIFSTVKSHVLILPKKWLGYELAIFTKLIWDQCYDF
jgi:hypothetical protein